MTKNEETPKNRLPLFTAITSGAALVLSIIALIVALCGGHDERHHDQYKMGPHYEMRGEPGGMERGYNPRELPQSRQQGEMGEGGGMRGGPQGGMQDEGYEESPRSEQNQPDFQGQP